MVHNIFFLFIQGWNKYDLHLEAAKNPPIMHMKEDHPYSTDLQWELGGEESLQQIVPWMLLHCGGRHRQLDLTSWVEFDWISIGTVSHTL